ncbi:PREDICTED: uncharacterized protein LOC106114575 [Papilio xuthus]|uniref:Uncharacterized protein LOC106114575 n=1 Tax=Papilio xuthus TaxID=66420 RepID=A0AAJ7E5B4_PAPXU|nr:PREDICTED: uncharacterized protein LOC106114575 [Papilio xuthus]
MKCPCVLPGCCYINIVLSSGQYKLPFRILTIPQRRIYDMYDNIMEIPDDVEDLPRAEPIMPGHTLLRPALGMLKSSVMFPQKDYSNFVYGNIDKLGITYGNTYDRVLYTDVRKTNQLLDVVKSLYTNDNTYSDRRNSQPYTILQIPIKPKKNLRKRNFGRTEISRNNPKIGVLLVQADSSEYPDDRLKIRRSHPRRSSKSKSHYRLRDKFYEKSSSDSSAVEESESHERNAGNPYTVHKNHYKQNWMWNHIMTGDHMNVNPYAPLINNYGPSGAALIFGRKWWYFNQRRIFFSYDRGEVTNIAGVPHSPKHLPLAESILPGHTLIRPALGMLKSSLKFPHMDFEDGSGVYGNTDNIGLRYNGANERVMYSDFRRRASDYLMVVPQKNIENQSKPR